MMDLFLTNMQLFTSQDFNWWTGAVWITCGLLWCFYHLFGLSFWRHPLTWWSSNVMLHFSKSVLMNKQTRVHLGWPEGEYTFNKLKFWVNYSFKNERFLREAKLVLLLHCYKSPSWNLYFEECNYILSIAWGDWKLVLFSREFHLLLTYCY